jgi:hypothetical protein
MKLSNNILILAAVAFAIVACTNDKEVLDFKSDRNTIEVGASGGVEKVKISSSDEWVASVGMQEDGTPNPWITVSPANGRGSVTCDFVIDSALTTKPREARVTIRNIATNKEQRIIVKQHGYDYAVEIDESSIEIERYAEYSKRYFDVVVRSNFDFDVEIPQSARHWISRETPSRLGEGYQLNLDRGVRPREVKVRFNWKINNSAEVRLADIKFVPKEDLTVKRSDILRVKQEASEPIIPETRAGDSLALLNIANTMQCWTVWDSSTPMDTWQGITLWKDHMAGSTGKVGRVKSVEIFLCNSFESLPYEFQYLTQAEEIYIFSNENSMLKSLSVGEHICKLTNLKRLTVGAFGLSELPDEFANLKNLEFLDLGSNNFQSVPAVLTKENFPNLRALVLNAQQRHAVSDLSNTVYETEKLGGLIEESSVPTRLLTWGLDTLVLSVNYLHGSLPSFEDDPTVPKWTESEVLAADTLPTALIGTPKIMPTTKTFRINHNRLSGEVPKWLLMHPALDWWEPFSLVFPQEGRDANGTKAGFTDAPASLVEYYKNWYPNKKLANSIEEEIPEDDGVIKK